MTYAHLRLILNTKTEKSARVVLGRVFKRLEADLERLEPYHKGGYEANLTITVPDGTWSDRVFYIICAAQSLGAAWYLGGRVEEELNMTADHFSIPGLTFAWLSYRRDEIEVRLH